MINILKNFATGRAAQAVVLTMTLATAFAQGNGNNQVAGMAGAGGASNVVVTNTAAQPVPTKDQNDGAYQPFHFTTPITTNVAFARVNVPVPAGKRLVIEQVSAAVSVWGTNGSYPSLSVSGNAAGADASAWVTMTYNGESDFGYGYFTLQPIHLYADGGTNAVLSIYKSRDVNHAYSGTVSGNISISGHLVNVP